MYYVSEYKSIFLFLIPLLHAVYLECNIYASINLVWLIVDLIIIFQVILIMAE